MEVRCGEQRIDFLAGKELDRPANVTLAGHGAHALRQATVLGCMQSDIAEERVNGCQTHVAAAGAVIAILYEMIEKVAEQRCIEIRHYQLRGSFTQPLLGVLQQ